MARKLKSTESKHNDRDKLLAALKFASVALDKTDNTATSQYVAIRDNWLMAENETFTIGVPIDIGLEICPQAEKFTAALENCGSEFQLTQTAQENISIKSGNFRAVVQAVMPDLIRPLNPDASVASIGQSLLEAFKICQKAISGKGDRAIDVCCNMKANSIIATNGAWAIEAWHGEFMPLDFLIPKKTVDTIVKIDKTFQSIGASEKSVTFYFDDMSFIQTKLIDATWPDTDKLFNDVTNSDSVPVWKGLIDALKAVDKFIENDTVFFHNGLLATSINPEFGASYVVPSLPGNLRFSASYLRAVLQYAETISIRTDTSKPHKFFGNGIRGLIMGRH